MGSFNQMTNGMNEAQGLISELIQKQKRLQAELRRKIRMKKQSTIGGSTGGGSTGGGGT